MSPTGSAGLFLLRDATATDVAAIARLHRRAYSRDHFLALLPEAALADYYRRFLGQGSRIVLAMGCAGSGGVEELLGFAVFGRNIGSRIAEWKRDCRRVILWAALLHPLMALQKLLISFEGVLRTEPRFEEAPVALLSIAVRSGGQGIGSALLEDMLLRTGAAGEDRIGLYVRHRNVRALNAYLRVGFRIVTSTKDQYYMERRLVNAPPK